MVVSLPVLRTGRLYPQEMPLVLISTNTLVFYLKLPPKGYSPNT